MTNSEMIETGKQQVHTVSNDQKYSSILIAHEKPSTCNIPHKAQRIARKDGATLKPSNSVLGRCFLDLALIASSFVLAYFFRFNLQFGTEIPENRSLLLSDYYIYILGFTLTFSIILQFKGFYRNTRKVTLLDEFMIIASSAAYSGLGMLLVIFLFQPAYSSRLLFLYLFPLVCLLLGSERIVVRYIKQQLIQRGIGLSRVVVIGVTDVSNRLMQQITRNPGMGLSLVGFVDEDPSFSDWALPLRYKSGGKVPYLGNFDSLAGLFEAKMVEQVILALPASMHTKTNELANFCYKSGVEVMLVPDLFELQLNTLEFQELKGIPLIRVGSGRLTGWNTVIKRWADFVLATLLLSLSVLPLALIALAVRLDSPGPALFRQTRVGKNGQKFTLFKFRSMFVDAEARFEELKKYNHTGGATFKMENDPRCTRLGRLIRKTSLDELPQLFNILLGQMSFVGPRPGLERELEEYSEWHFRRLEVIPGLTGLAQISGRSNLKFSESIQLDIYYIESWSFWSDIKIILRTVPSVLFGKGAY